MTTSVI